MNKLERHFLPTTPPTRALPAVAAEVPLEASKLRVLLTQGSDVRLVAHDVEPAPHDGELFAHLLLNLVPRRLGVVDLPSGHAAKRFGYLGHGLLISRQIHLAPHPLVRLLKGWGS